ncbi:hypothetical protein SASC598O02_011220 [Snodgrassella alvi SCGC AB-598-O02]|nr:hypothetical protein [Snodgrassella alvi]KES10119.1 hypothetical protein SASC598O02_011220 [Snodgrassella alvi SCGC AB-598-O02]
MKRYRIITTLIFTAGLCSAYSVEAKVYTCLQNGQVTYTAKPSGNCAEAHLPAIGRYSSNSSPRTKIASTNIGYRPRKTTPTRMATYKGPQPTVNIVPKGNDINRKTVLQTELNNERKALAEAQQALNRSRTGKGGDITALQSAVLDRQQNVQALQRELSRM